MKTFSLSTLLPCFAALVALSVAAAPAAPPAKPPAADSQSTTNVPLSVFTIPAGAGQARDPFFPTRVIQAGSTNVSATAVAAHPAPRASCLILNGLSGTTAKRLAMINGYTMAQGDDAEINTRDCGRLMVHCVEITSTSAVIEVSGERRELHLRSDF
jgi:hypothetical protein